MGLNSSKARFLGETKLSFSLKESKNQLKMMDYGLIKLTSIIEAYKYWKYNVSFAKRINISRQIFEDIFGSLLADPDNHFEEFAITNNIGNKSCNLYEILCMLSIFCNESVESKVNFLFDLFRTEEAKDYKISSKEIHVIIDHIIIVINHLFKIKDIDKYTIINTIDKVMSLLYNRIQANINNSIIKVDDNGPTKAEIDGIRLTFPEFWQLCQDTSIIWDFLNTIDSITRILVLGKVQTFEEEKEKNTELQQSSKEGKEDVDELDEIDDHQCDDINTRMMKLEIKSGIVDYVALTSVYIRHRHTLWNYTIKNLVDEDWLISFPYVTSEDVVFTALENMVCLSKSYFPIFYKEAMASYADTPLSPSAIAKNNLNKINTQRPRDKFELFCIIDTNIILKLVAEQSPYMFKESEVPEENQSSQNTNDQVDMKMKGLERSRQGWGNKANNLTSQQQWEDFGNSVASSSIRQLIEKHSSIEESKPQILLTENYLYDLIYLIAQGHRSIPIATSKLFPNKVTYVLSDVDVAQFIFKNCNEILGKLMRLPVQKTHLMKKVLSIKCDTKVGTAIYSMVSHGVDIAAIIDEHGKICGRLSSDVLNKLWLSWYQQYIHDPDISIEEVMASYNQNNFKSYSSKDNATKHVVFAKLLSSLKTCELLHLKYFHEVMNKEIDLDEDDDESYSSQSSSSSVSRSDFGDDDGSKSIGGLSKTKETEKSVSKKSSVKRTGRSRSPSKKKSTNRKSKSPSKRKSMRSNSPNKSSRGKRSIQRRSATIQVDKSTPKNKIALDESSSKPSEITSPRSNNDDAISPLRPSEISLGRTFKKRDATLTKGKNLKILLEEQRLQNIEKQKAETEAKRIKILKARIELAKERVQWFKELGVVKVTDSIAHALEAMTITKSTKVFVGTADGILQGVITLRDICRILIKQENKLKSIQAERATLQE